MAATKHHLRHVQCHAAAVIKPLAKLAHLPTRISGDKQTTKMPDAWLLLWLICSR
jgi:hypothetical protein